MSSSTSPAGRSALTLDQLIALNDEIAALTRAGAPLSSGLRHLGREMPGRLGALAQQLSERLERGESLADAVADGSPPFPPLYRAVIAAGVRSGRLSAALEGIAFVSRRLAEMRRMIGAAMIYPAIVMMIAVWLFVFFLTTAAPAIVSAYDEFNLPLPGAFRSLAEVRNSAALAPGLALAPLAIPLLLGAWWLYTRRAPMDLSPMALGGGWTPAARALINAGRRAVFADTLALMLEHQTPLDEALILAADASGDRRLSADARRLAEAVRRGAPGLSADEFLPHFPPLLRWLALGAHDERVCQALRLAADSYRQQALRQAQWLNVWAPLFFSGILGGGAAVTYAVLLLAPWFNLLYELSRP